MKKSLTRLERLRGREALGKVFSISRGTNSVAFSCPGLRLMAVRNGLEYSRFVVSSVRKYGGAVARNRARRVAKEAYRSIKSSIKPGFDLAFILFPCDSRFRKNSGDFLYGERISQFLCLLTKADLLRED